MALRLELAKANIDTIKNYIFHESRRKIRIEYPCPPNSEVCTPLVAHFKPGRYTFECWGAQGGNDDKNLGGKGAYTKGSLILLNKTSFLLFLGQQGQLNFSSITYNGGGRGATYGSSGGGATDIRMTKKVNENFDWFDFQSLKRRIMVAAGGGGYTTYGMTKGGSGGTFSGKNGPVFAVSAPIRITEAKGGHQRHGGRTGEKIFDTDWQFCGSTNGTFGAGGSSPFDAARACSEHRFGGGSGYFGGGAGIAVPNNVGSGAGGSSFISGMKGCIAIDQSSTDPQNMIMKENSMHYSGVVFQNATMMDEDNPSFPSPTGEHESGHAGSGVICITVDKIFSSSPFSTKKMINKSKALTMKLVEFSMFVT